MDYAKDDGVLIEDIIFKHHHPTHQEFTNNQTQIELGSQLEYEGDFPTFYPNGSRDDDNDYPFNETLGFVSFSERPETYIVPILFALIFIVGVAGNGCLIWIFIKHRTMRNVPNTMLQSLAVGDLLVILFCVPFTSTVYTLESWPFGEFVCKFSEFIKDLSIGVSVYTLTALSADRYFAIVSMRKRRATKMTFITIAGIWVLSISMALPSALFSYVRVIDEVPSHVFYVCYPFPPELGDIYPQVMVMLHFLVYYAIPLFFIATFYIIMARHLLLSTRNMPGEAQGQAKQIEARKKVAKMILSFVVIFMICFFPSHLFRLWFYFNPNSQEDFNDFWHICRIAGFCLAFINSCINPITLYCVSGTFRKKFNEHLFCCICEPEGRSRPLRRHAAGLACGCVSLSSTGGPYLGGNQRLRNGYPPGRALYRGSTTDNSLNGCHSTIKRKSTWDTQSTGLYNNYNTSVNPNYGNGDRDTPLGKSRSGSCNSSAYLHSTTTTTIPLIHQKDYQDYINRINALENGEVLPPPSSASLKKMKGGSDCITTNDRKKSTKCEQDKGRPSLQSETEFTVTSFIYLGGAGKMSNSSSDDESNRGVVAPLIERVECNNA